jgi:hypothetical protein
MAICFPLGAVISDMLARTAGRRVGRCGVAALAIALAGIFLAFGSSVDNARLASVVLAGGAGALYLSQSSFWSLSADIGGSFSGSVSGLMDMGAQTKKSPLFVYRHATPIYRSQSFSIAGCFWRVFSNLAPQNCHGCGGKRVKRVPAASHR